MGSGFAKKKKAFQEALLEMESKVKNTSVEGSAGAGLVTITINGEYQMEKIAIKPECVDPEDVEGLQDLIKAAYNDAAKKVKESCMPGLGANLSGFGF